MQIPNRSLVLCLLLVLGSFLTSKGQSSSPKGLVADHAMVVSAREEASKIGIEILKKEEMPLMR